VNRYALILLPALAAGAAAFAPGDAVAQVHRDAVGFPLRTITASFERGRTYELRTDYTLTIVDNPTTPEADPFVADTVLSLRDPATGQTLAGADGCTTPSGFQWGPSCFTVTIPGAVGSGAVSLEVRLRAWRTNTPGRTSVWRRNVSTSGADEQLVSGISFGGGVMTSTLTSERFVAQTTHLPGNNLTHQIWLTGSEWNIGQIEVANGRIAGQTASLDLSNPQASGLSGARQIVFGQGAFGQPGAIRLVHNNFWRQGFDWDGDGLDESVEAALGSCDRPAQVMPSGASCATRYGCSPSAGATCQASLRDTDRDGLRDDVEVFGWSPTVDLPRFGASPVHKDVFVELDFEDQNPNVAGCQSFASSTVKQLGGNTAVGADFFADANKIYGQMPSVWNPDGTPGIALHYDVGLVNPNPLDATWNAMGGGGTCLPTGCSYLAAFDRDSTTCGGAGNAGRSWAFAYGVDGPPGGGGQARSKVAYGASGASHHVHELGHVAGLQHVGPEGSTGGNSHAGNPRIGFPSRMNYLHQDHGNVNASDSVRWPQISFSSGGLAAHPSASMFTAEVCPFPGIGAAVADAMAPPGFPPQFVDGCYDFDWNQDGRLESATPVVFMADRERGSRWSLMDAPHVRRMAPAAAVVGDVLLHVSGTPDGARDRLTLRAEGNKDCIAWPLPASTPHIIEPYKTAGSYPGCYRLGDPVVLSQFADGVGVAAYQTTSYGGALVVWNDGGTLYHARVAVAPAANATEMTYSFVPQGPIPGAPAASMLTANREPALAGLGNYVALAYRGADGKIYQMQYDAVSYTWSGAGEVRRHDVSVPAGTPLFPMSAPALTYHGNYLVMAVTTFDTTIAVEVLVQRDPSTQFAARRWKARGKAIPLTALGSRPSITSAGSIFGPHRDLYVHVRDANFVHVYNHTRSAITDMANDSAGAPSFPWQGVADFAGGGSAQRTAPTVVYDARIDTFAGLRAFDEPQLGCGGDCPGSCTAGVCTSGGVALSTSRLMPFGQGPEPGFYGDYDEWKALDWGFCDRAKVWAGSAPTSATPYVWLPYSTPPECGPRPTYVEPGD